MFVYLETGRAGAVGVMELEFWIVSEIYLSILLPLCFFIDFINAGVSSAFLFSRFFTNHFKILFLFFQIFFISMAGSLLSYPVRNFIFFSI